MTVASMKDLTNRILHIQVSSIKSDLLRVVSLPAGPSIGAKVRLLHAVQRFAPEVRFHPDESNLPSSVAWYLARVRMRKHRKWKKDKQILDGGQVNIESLVSQSDGGDHSGSGTEGTEFFLEILDNDKEDTRRGNLDSSECYIHFRNAPGNSPLYDIQYWFFFPYNGFGPGHEGDWEHITVRVSSDFSNIVSIFYASHAKESEWCSPEKFLVNSTGNPIVYCAKGSHACYRSNGKKSRPWPRPDDHTGDGGPVWNTWQNLAAVGEVDSPIDGQLWVKYTGHWGEIGEPGTSAILVTSGPHGPAFQAWWHEDDAGNSGA